MIRLKTHSDYKKMIDEELKRIFVKLTRAGAPRILYAAMRYSVFSGGKRIRPILCLMTYDSITNQKSNIKKQNYDKILPFACGLELIHTFSLIQDDLPCMDNDDFRRGKPSLHKQYDEAVALLAADALFALAFELFAKARVADIIKNLAIIELADISGINGLAAGQVRDILSQNKKVKIKNQKFIDEKKTARLIAGAMKIGAIIAGAQTEVIDKIEKAGTYLGLLFQKTDDMLDKTQISNLKSQQLFAQSIAGKAKENFKKIGESFSDFIILTDSILVRTR